MDRTAIIAVLQHLAPLVGAFAIFFKGFIAIGAFAPGVRKRRALHDYELIEKFMQTPLCSRSRIEVELAISAWLRLPMKYQEIKAVMDFANPAAAFRLFKVASPFIEQAKNGRFVYRPKYTRRNRRNWIIWSGIIAYFLFAFFALGPLLVLRPIKPVPSGWWAIALIDLVIFVYAAWLSMDFAGALKRTETFMNEQKLKP